MKRTIDRTLQILLWGVAVTLVWGLVGLTPWGAARSVVDAGPGYDHALQPVGYFVGALLVAVPGILLVNRSSAAWRRRHATVEPAACPEKPGIAK